MFVEIARLLVDIAIKARTEMHGVDREETCYWIHWPLFRFVRATYDQAGWRFAGETFSSFWMVICL